MTNLMLRVK